MEIRYVSLECSIKSFVCQFQYESTGIGKLSDLSDFEVQMFISARLVRVQYFKSSQPCEIFSCNGIKSILETSIRRGQNGSE